MRTQTLCFIYIHVALWLWVYSVCLLNPYLLNMIFSILLVQLSFKRIYMIIQGRYLKLLHSERFNDGPTIVST